MRLPEVADRLRDLAAAHGIPELRTLASEIRRRPVRRRANPVSTPMSANLRAQIRACARTNPHLTQVEIAEHFGVNQGRVSEALRGKRQ